MAQDTLVPGPSSPTPTSETVPVPAVPAPEAGVVPDQGADSAPGNTPCVDANPVDFADSGAVVPSAPTTADTSSGGLPPANFLTPAEVEEMSLAGVISGVPTLADTGMALAPVSWDAPLVYNGPDVHLVGVPASVAARRSGAKVYPGHGGLEILLCFESLDSTDLHDLDTLMGGDVADCLPFLRPRVAPASLATEVSSIASQRELAALLDRLAERMINSFSFIRRLLATIRHLQAASEAESNGTLSSATLEARDNFDTKRREWTVMCRHGGQRVRSLERARTDSENFLRQGHRDAESRHQARITELTDQVAQLQAQVRDSEATRQAAERRADERVLDVNALVDFLMGNKPQINVMFNWMRLAALLHHFAEGTPIPEGWLTNINVVALDDPRCECPEYAKPSPRPGNGDSSSGSSGSKRPSVLDLSPPARNKRPSTSGSRTGSRKRKASATRDAPVSKRPSLSPAQDSRHQLDCQLRPRGYSPRDMLVYSPRNVPNARNQAEAGRALPAGMLWTDVREDVQHLLLSGMVFKCAMKWVSESQGIHHLAPREAVCRMLAQVIHAGQLDESPWCRFVCRMLAQVIHAGQLDETPWCRYTSAEGTLRIRQAKRESTPPWHPLGRCFVKVQKRKQSTRETEALQAKLPESSDDEVQDPSYELSQAEMDKTARAEANDESSEDSDKTGKESKPAATHLSPASSREPKTGKAGGKHSGSKSRGAPGKFEYRVITSSKSPPTPKSGGASRARKMPVLSLATFLRRARVEVPPEGLRRIRSKLAKLNYDDLQGEHLDTMEAACRGTHVSYRIFGILVKFDSYRQSQGYPDFEPHKPDIHIQKARWDLEAYQALVYVPEPVNGRPARDEDGEYIRAPWSVMFYYRVTVFYFHEVRDLNSETLDGIQDYVDFMRINAKTWWAILHWLTISFVGRDVETADASRDLYEERRRDVKRLRARYEALLKRLFAIPGFPKILLYEPGLWTLPVCACHWIFKDPERSPLIRRGVADYAAQLDDLDGEDPVRTQWAAAHSDNDILATVPALMHPLLMQPERRARNVIPLSAASQA